MWDACAQLNIPVAIHVSDPVAFFTPTDRFNERYEELNNHPDWSFYGGDSPSNAELLEARNRVFAYQDRILFGTDATPHGVRTHAPAVGDTFRINLFRSQGPPPNRIEVVWQPTMSHTFQTPERFGILQLVAEEPK
jgi:hypothetical protein